MKNLYLSDLSLIDYFFMKIHVKNHMVTIST